MNLSKVQRCIKTLNPTPMVIAILYFSPRHYSPIPLPLSLAWPPTDSQPPPHPLCMEDVGIWKNSRMRQCSQVKSARPSIPELRGWRWFTVSKLKQRLTARTRLMAWRLVYGRQRRTSKTALSAKDLPHGLPHTQEAASLPDVFEMDWGISGKQRRHAYNGD